MSSLLQLLCIFLACFSVHARSIQDVDPTPSPKFQCPEKEGFFPDPTDCSKFYQCANYLAWEHQCPGKLYFNKATAQCDFPENVDCHQHSIKQPIKVQDIDPTPGTTFECPADTGFYPNPSDCTKFYHCFNHIAWQEQCSAGLYFNPTLNVCDFPENVDCHQDSIKQPIKVQDIEPTPSPAFKCPAASGLYPNPSDCTKFYHCANNIAWEEQCSVGLYFNPTLSVCDFPENVDCH